MTSRSLIILLFGLILQSFVAGHISAQDDTVAEAIREKVEQIKLKSELKVGNSQISSFRVLPGLYQRRDFRPIWTDTVMQEELISSIEDTYKEGLDPNDYHLEEINQLRAQLNTSDPHDPEMLALIDLLLTDSLARLAYHSIFGKEDPLTHHPHWNLAVKIDDIDPVGFLEKAIESDSLAKTISGWKPQFPIYQRLMMALAKYRSIQASGGWNPVPSGPTLRKGLEDKRVPPLRQRLAATGDLTYKSTDSTVFDETLELAVIHFQARHRLHPDGAVGRNTLEALNVPVEQRIDQILVNLERARWVLHALGEEFVLVDIAGFHVFLYQDRKVIWTSRVQVGKPYRNTPVFRSAIEYLEFNPTWTIPPGILSKDILPATKNDPDYLNKRNINVLDRNGNLVDQSSIDWSQYPGRSFPYMLRQEPGPNNALGRVKFIFPNKHFVYLHDTPSKSLFDKTSRTFSSGCIRVENPFELAELLLNDSSNWNYDKIMEVVDSKQTRKVFPDEPMPVLLLYWTVTVEEDGKVHFKEDPYGRDNAVLEGLKGKFRIRSIHR
jgi:murein L,D-transpeptidase YcbB/YkuD